MSTAATAAQQLTMERSKTSTATIIKMTDWSPVREPCMATATVVRTDRSIQPANLDEARQLIAKLTERNNAQGHLLQAWKNRLKQQNEMVAELHREREEQMRLLTSQLLLLEANLRAKQGKIDALLNQRDRVISAQQETIRSLERELDRCRLLSSVQPQRPQSLPITSSLDHPESTKQSIFVVNDKTPTDSTERNRQTQPRPVRVLGREQGDESLDDSDSAVVIDDDHRHSPTFIENSQVRVIRSISDVVDSSRAGLSLFMEKQHHHHPGILKSSRLVRNHQRRVMFQQPEEPEVEEENEEEEEEDEQSTGSSGSSSSSDDSPFNKRGHKTFLRGSFERMPVQPDSNRSGLSNSSSSSSAQQLRAATHCSNHRSVTRPRDVKFKKNNKGSPGWKAASDVVVHSDNVASIEFQTSLPHLV